MQEKQQKQARLVDTPVPMANFATIIHIPVDDIPRDILDDGLKSIVLEDLQGRSVVPFTSAGTGDKRGV